MAPVVPIRNHSARPPALQTRCSTSHHVRSTWLAETLADVLFKWHRRQYVRLLQMRDVADSTVSYVGKLCHFEARSQGFMLFKFVVQHCTMGVEHQSVRFRLGAQLLHARSECVAKLPSARFSFSFSLSCSSSGFFSSSCSFSFYVKTLTGTSMFLQT